VTSVLAVCNVVIRGKDGVTSQKVARPSTNARNKSYQRFRKADLASKCSYENTLKSGCDVVACTKKVRYQHLAGNELSDTIIES